MDTREIRESSVSEDDGGGEHEPKERGIPIWMSFFRLEKKERRKRGPRPRDILPSHCRPAFFICIQCRRRHPRGFEPFPALSTRPIIRMSFNMAAHRNYPTNRANACPRILSLLFHSFLAERRIGGNWNERDWREGRLKGGVPPLIETMRYGGNSCGL